MDTNDQIRDLYQRTEKAMTDSALNQQRIDMHEKACIEKHEAVINKLTSNTEKLEKFMAGHNRWMISLLTAIILAFIGVMITH